MHMRYKMLCKTFVFMYKKKNTFKNNKYLLNKYLTYILEQTAQQIL